MSLLSRVLDLRHGEASLTGRAFVTLFGLIAGHTMLETARDALFLETLPASRLTLVYLALALVGALVPSYTGRIGRAFGRRNATVFTLMAAAFGTTIWYFQPVTAASVYGLYIWSALLGTVMVLQFWVFAGQLFTVAQGKRLFAGITAGGVLGAVSGGGLAAGLLTLLPQHDDSVRLLLLIAAAFFWGSALVLTTIPTEDVGPGIKPQKRNKLAAGGLSVLNEHRYVARLALVVGLSTATLLATDYLFKLVVKSQVPAAELGSFFARYYAGLNAVALAVQVLLAPWVVRRFGVAAALTVLPVMLLAGAGGMFLSGGLIVTVLLTKGADGALRHTLHRVASELLYLPLPASVRERAKAVIDAVFVRGAQAVTAGVILLLASRGLGDPKILVLMVGGLAIAWVSATLTLRARYLDQLRSGLVAGSLDARLLSLKDLDLRSVEAVVAALSSPDPQRVIAAMNLLDEAGRGRLVPALILYHESEEVLIRALELVSRIDEQEWTPHAERLTKHPSVAVRTEAVWTLGMACEPERVTSALEDPSAKVRATAAFQLARCQGDGDPLEHPAIVSLLSEVERATEEQRVELRLGLLEALARGADSGWADALLALATSNVPEVLQAVAQAMTRVQDERFIPRLIDMLTVRKARATVRDALVKHGPRALDALADAISDPSSHRAIRHHGPLVVAAFGGQRAAKVLMTRLGEETDGALRYRALRGLTRMVAADPLLRLDRSLIERELERNLLECFRLQALTLPLRGATKTRTARASRLLLTGLLDDKVQQAGERISRLVKLAHPREDIRGLFLTLRSKDKRARANALEFLDAMTLQAGDTCRELLRLFADDLTAEERVERTASHVGGPRDLATALGELLQDGDDSVAALTAYHGLSLDEEELSTRAAALFAQRPALRQLATSGYTGGPHG